MQHGHNCTVPGSPYGGVWNRGAERFTAAGIACNGKAQSPLPVCAPCSSIKRPGTHSEWPAVLLHIWQRRDIDTSALYVTGTAAAALARMHLSVGYAPVKLEPSAAQLRRRRVLVELTATALPA